ncbi:MAG: helix-turn-helix transcriptional regulator, partial [Alphaproteobacteria bacterium]
MSDRVSSASSERSAVGELLRATRLRYGWDLEDVEVALRIRLSHLEAIESGRLQDLPGATYAVGFVRAYADHLGLDREEVVARFREEISDLPNRTQLNFPKPIPESRVPSAIVLLVAAALAVGAYGGWYYVTIGKQLNVESVAEVPQQLAQESPADTSGQT